MTVSDFIGQAKNNDETLVALQTIRYATHFIIIVSPAHYSIQSAINKLVS